MREFVWNPEKDDGKPGTAEQQSKRDQRCSGCGRWFTPEGIGSHEEHCEFAEHPMIEWDEERERLQRVFCADCDASLPIDASPEEYPRRHGEECRHAPDAAHL